MPETETGALSLIMSRHRPPCRAVSVGRDRSGTDAQCDFVLPSRSTMHVAPRPQKCRGFAGGQAPVQAWTNMTAQVPETMAACADFVEK